MRANDKQIGGTHYRSQAQHWDYIADAGWGEGYFKGVITKYLSRWRKKNGQEDLEKALHYVEKLIELVQQGKIELRPPKLSDALFIAINFSSQSRDDTFDSTLLHRVFYAAGVYDLKEVEASLRMELDRLDPGP